MAVLLLGKGETAMVRSRYYRFKLSEQERKVYDALEQGIRRQQEKIPVPLFAPERMSAVLQAVQYDNPEFFHVIFSACVLWHGPVTRMFEMHYRCTGERYAKLLSRINVEARGVVSIKRSQDQYQTALGLHDWLLANSRYGTLDNREAAAHTLVGPFLDHVCVCEGYAKAYKYLCNLADIPCAVELGESRHPDGTGGGHAWNMIELDHRRYHVDVTFDALIGNQYCSRAYFLLSDQELSYDHIPQKEVTMPPCPVSGSRLKLVNGTARLKAILREEALSGATHTELRLTKAFGRKEMDALLTTKIMAGGEDWLTRLDSFWYGDKNRTLFVTWRKK